MPRGRADGQGDQQRGPDRGQQDPDHVRGPRDEAPEHDQRVHGEDRGVCPVEAQGQRGDEQQGQSEAGPEQPNLERAGGKRHRDDPADRPGLLEL
jgi:hypothetical protein